MNVHNNNNNNNNNLEGMEVDILSGDLGAEEEMKVQDVDGDDDDEEEEGDDDEDDGEEDDDEVIVGEESDDDDKEDDDDDEEEEKYDTFNVDDEPIGGTGGAATGGHGTRQTGDDHSAASSSQYTTSSMFNRHGLSYVKGAATAVASTLYTGANALGSILTLLTSDGSSDDVIKPSMKLVFLAANNKIDLKGLKDDKLVEVSKARKDAKDSKKRVERMIGQAQKADKQIREHERAIGSLMEKRKSKIDSAETEKNNYLKIVKGIYNDNKEINSIVAIERSRNTVTSFFQQSSMKEIREKINLDTDEAWEGISIHKLEKAARGLKALKLGSNTECPITMFRTCRGTFKNGDKETTALFKAYMQKVLCFVPTRPVAVKKTTRKKKKKVVRKTPVPTTANGITLDVLMELATALGAYSPDIIAKLKNRDDNGVPHEMKLSLPHKMMAAVYQMTIRELTHACDHAIAQVMMRGAPAPPAPPAALAAASSSSNDNDNNNDDNNNNKRAADDNDDDEHNKKPKTGDNADA